MNLTQLLSINFVIILLGFLKGALVNVQYIQAQALYLTDHSARSLIYVILAPMLVWFVISFYLRRAEIEKVIRLFLPAFLVLGLSLCFLVTNPIEGQLYVIIWIFLAGFINEFCRWGFFEILDRYVNPSRAGSIASYQLLAAEVAVLVTSLSFQFLNEGTHDFVVIVTWTATILLGLVLLVFLNPRILEIYYMRGKAKITGPLQMGAVSIAVGFVILGSFLGLFRMFQDNISNTFFQNYYSNPQDLRSVISMTMLIGSLIQITSIFTSAKFIESKRFSPIKTMCFAWLINLASGIFAITYNNIYGFIFFMSVPKGVAGFYYPALARLTNSFQYTLSTTFNTLHVIGLVVVAGFVFAWVPNNPVIQYGFLVAIPLVAMAFIFIYRNRIEKKLSENLSSMNLEESVKAAVGLSFLQPSGFVEKMSQVLETEPHRLLKKQIILALGYSQESKATEILLENFMSDQEEIQITVLEAMKIAKNFRATRFAVDLLLSKKQSLTPRVRLSAAQMIAALYGKKSIPILLQGLGEDDPRLVANTLEALGHFHDLEILQIVKPYIKSEIPRVRANALMYIHKFSSQKKIFKEEIRKTLSSVDEKRTAEKISIFYVIGKIKDKTFLPDLNKIFQSKASEFLNLNIEDDVKISFFQTLLWALYRLDEDTSGQKLYDLLIKFTDKFQRRSVLHFFLQLDASERYDLLDLWLKIANNPKGVRENLLDIFNESGLNLFEEVEYLKSLKFYRA